MPSASAPSKGLKSIDPAPSWTPTMWRAFEGSVCPIRSAKLCVDAGCICALSCAMETTGRDKSTASPLATICLFTAIPFRCIDLAWTDRRRGVRSGPTLGHLGRTHLTTTSPNPKGISLIAHRAPTSEVELCRDLDLPGQIELARYHTGCPAIEDRIRRCEQNAVEQIKRFDA